MVNTFLFNGLPEACVEAIVNEPDCRIVDFKKNDVIYDKTHFSRSLGVVISGSAAVRSSSKDGVIMRYLSDGMCFGVASLYNEDSEYISVINAMKDCKVLFIPQSIISKYIAAYPKLAENYIKFLTNRIQYLNTLIDAYASPNVETKLARYLTAYVDGVDLPFDINMTRLSKSLGIGRASLYRALDSFVSKNIIKKDGKVIQIIDFTALKKF